MDKTCLTPPTSWDTDWLGAKPAINKPPAPPVPKKGPGKRSTCSVHGAGRGSRPSRPPGGALDGIDVMIPTINVYKCTGKYN